MLNSAYLQRLQELQAAVFSGAAPFEPPIMGTDPSCSYTHSCASTSCATPSTWDAGSAKRPRLDSPAPMISADVSLDAFMPAGSWQRAYRTPAEVLSEAQLQVDAWAAQGTTAVAVATLPSSLNPSTAPQGAVPAQAAEESDDKELSSVVQQCLTHVQGSLSDMAGLEAVKQELRQAVLMPMRHPKLFTGLRSPQRTFLLYGPPGTGKTMIVEKVCAEAGLKLLSVSPSSVLSKWSGESERTVRRVFQAARRLQPCAIFIDEIDSLAPRRDGGGGGEEGGSRRLLTELLLQLNTVCGGAPQGGGAPSTGQQQEGGAGGVYVFAATNRLQDCDLALLRRFSRRLQVPLPDGPARAALLKMLLSGSELRHDLGDLNTPTEEGGNFNLMRLVDMTEGYNCSDLVAVCKCAAMLPITDLLEQHPDAVTIPLPPPSSTTTTGSAPQEVTSGAAECVSLSPSQLRPITIDDIERALECVQASATDQQRAAEEGT